MDKLLLVEMFRVATHSDANLIHAQTQSEIIIRKLRHLGFEAEAHELKALIEAEQRRWYKDRPYPPLTTHHPPC